LLPTDLTSPEPVHVSWEANLRGWLDRGATNHPNKVLVKSIEQRKSATYGDVQEFCRRLSNKLGKLGLSANDRVALLANNSLEHLLIYLGVMYYGATICTIHVENNLGMVRKIVKALEPKLVIFEENLGLESKLDKLSYLTYPLGTWSRKRNTGIWGEVETYSPEINASVNEPDDFATIFFTSGTTAEPKGILYKFRHLEENVSAVTEAFDINSKDLLFDYRSFNWASAQMLSALGVICQGATLLLGRKFSQSRFFGWIETYKPTVVVGNPTVFNMLLSADNLQSMPKLSSVRFMTSSSAPLLVSDWNRFEERFKIPIIQGYGSSEAGWISATSLQQRRLGSVGKPLAYHDLSIVGEDGSTLSIGEVGNIELGSEQTREFGYLKGNGSIETTDVGRLRTGDLGYLDEDGFLFLIGRSKELIIRGGINISPMEIDHVISQLPGVIDVASVGVPDKIYGEKVVAFVIISRDIDLAPKEIESHCRDRLAAVKVPESIYIVNDIPRSERGKLDRNAVKKMWQEIEGQ